MGQQFDLEEEYPLNEEIDGDEFNDDAEIDMQEEEDVDDGEDGGEEEPNLVMVTYTDANGEAVEAYVTEEELSKLLNEEEDGKGAKGEDSQEELKKFAEATAPLVDVYNSSEIMRNIHYYRQQGYSDEQIKRGLVQLWQEELAAEDKPAAQAGENADLQQVVDQKLGPVQKELETLRYQQAVKDAYANNEMVLSNKLKEYGWTDKLGDKEIQAMSDVLNTVFKDKDKYTLMLTDKDADIIVRASLGYNQKSGRGKSKAVKLGRQANAPTIQPGKGGKRTSGKTPRGTQKTENLSLEERLERKKELFS